MTESYFTLLDLASDFQKAYDAVMYGSKLPSNDCEQETAIAFGQQVKQTLPNDYLSTSVKHGYHNQFSCSLSILKASVNLPSATSESSYPKQLPISILGSEELFQGGASEVSIKSKKSDSGSESEIEIVHVRSMANKEGAHFVNNSHQYSKIQISPIIQADNLGNEFVPGCFTKKNATSRQPIDMGEKPFKCKDCRMCFDHKSHLLLHRRVHTGEKPFECELCKKCFSQKGNLKVHRLIHTPKKSNECKQCGMCFANKHALEMHQRIHTGEEYFKCNQCDKIFAKNRYLTAHQRTHTVKSLKSASSATKSLPLTIHSR